ncbi:MAG: HU family DNA-binding protein [Verrucomicrobiales bacterium]
MNRRTFASRIAAQTAHPANAVESILEAAISVLAGELAQSGRFAWRGLGTFTVRSYAARQIHNPATGATLTLPARRSVSFKPSSKLRGPLGKPRRTRAKASANGSRSIKASKPPPNSKRK